MLRPAFLPVFAASLLALTPAAPSLAAPSLASPRGDVGPSQRYVTYIRSSPAAVWKALTDPDQTEKFFHHTRVKTSLEPGGAFQHLGGRGKAIIDGKVLKVVPEEELVFSFRFPAQNDEASRVSYKISKAGKNTVKLVILHDQFGGRTKTFNMVRDGWPPVVAGLKTLLETGQPLKIEKE